LSDVWFVRERSTCPTLLKGCRATLFNNIVRDRE